MPPTDQPAHAVDAALGYVARAPSPLMLAPLEDLAGLVEQPNLPGTIDEHPNWRRRLGVPARELFDHAQKILERIIKEKKLTARGVYGFWPAHAEGDDDAAVELLAAAVVRRGTLDHGSPEVVALLAALGPHAEDRVAAAPRAGVATISAFLR